MPGSKWGLLSDWLGVGARGSGSRVWGRTSDRASSSALVVLLPPSPSHTPHGQGWGR